MSIIGESKKQFLLIIVWIGILLISITCVGCAPRTIFFSTTSPNRIYTVNLTGRKQRPRFFTNEVRFDVLKNGKPFVSNEFLHSGDAFDLSFEAGYPDYGWLDQNVLQFYRSADFKGGKPASLVVTNETDKEIKYLIVYSVYDLLIIEMPPHSERSLVVCPSRCDSGGFYIKGEFTSGGYFEHGGGCEIGKGLRGPFKCPIQITDAGVAIGNPVKEPVDGGN